MAAEARQERRIHAGRRRQFWAPVILVLIVGALVLWRLWPRDGLLDRAEKIADVPDWTGLEYITGRGPLYNWLNDTDVLFFRLMDPKQENPLLNAGKPNISAKLQGYRQTILPIGKAQPPVKVPNLTAVFWDPAIKAFAARGDWLLRWRYDAPTNRGLEELVSLKDGSVHPLENFTDASWSANGSCVLQRLPGKLLLYRPDTGITLHLYLPQMKEFLATPIPATPMWPTHHGPDSSEVLWLTPGNAMIFVRRSAHFAPQDVAKRPYMADYENTTTMEFARCDLADSNKSMTTWTAPVPADAITGKVSVAPSGDRLIWSMKIDGTRTIDRLLHKLLPGTFPATRTYFVYRITGLDGSHPREFLRYDDNKVNPRNIISGNAFQWMPDGKHLTFIYHGALYRVAVD